MRRRADSINALLCVLSAPHPKVADAAGHRCGPEILAAKQPPFPGDAVSLQRLLNFHCGDYNDQKSVSEYKSDSGSQRRR
jgi:hypothetical protein